MIKSIWNSLKANGKEILATLLFLAGFAIAPVVLTIIAPDSRQLDPAYLQMLFLGGVRFFFGVLLMWIFFAVAAPTLRDYIQDFRAEWQSVPEQWRPVIFLAFLGFVLWLAVKCLTYFPVS